jgi:hypothetical protein
MWAFVMALVVPILYGVDHQPFNGLVRMFAGGMVGAAWGRGVHASLEASDYAGGAMVLVTVVLGVWVMNHY